MSGPGTEYVFEQLGMALKASHELIAQQREQIEALRRAVPPSKVQCPECGAWSGEWCDSGCTAHEAKTCGLPHTTLPDGTPA